MTAITFDTLKFAKRLKDAGFTENQAEAQAQAFAEAVRESGHALATKADIAELRAATKLDIAELKTEIQAMINRLLLTLTGIIVGSMVAMAGIFGLIVKLL